MTLPPRFAPRTQLDALRALLAGYAGGDRTFLPQFHRILQSLRHMALPELGQRLGRNTTPRGLRSLILASTATFDWPDWDAHLMRMLQPEEDLGLFDEGCAALGGLCTQRALQGLRRLKALRRGRDHQGILDRELERYHPDQPFDGCLGWLQEGQADPERARAGARGLAVLLDARNLLELLEVFRQGDALTRRLALHLLAFLQDPVSEGLLLTLFQEVREEILGVRHATGFTAPLQALSRESLRETLDDIAGLLAARVEAGRASFEDTMPVLEEAFHALAGGDGLLIAYLRLIPSDDRERLDRILAEPEVARRARCIEVLGAREEDRLVPVFLAAMKDPSPEVSQLAIRQFGKLPSGAPAMLELFASGEWDQMREAIRFFGENRTPAAVQPLMGFLTAEAPDDMLVDAVNALGSICDPVATNALLALLHDGKPLLLQVALAEALGRLGMPGASLGLLKKSEQLKVPQVLLLALEGALAAFPGFDRAFPVEQAALLERLVDRCCDAREGGGQWQGAATALGELYVFDAELYRRLKGRLAEFMMTSRPKSAADREHRERIGDILKGLLQRAEGLAMREDREGALAGLMEAFPASGPDRMKRLLRMREILAAPGLILGVSFAQHLVAFLRRELLQEGADLDTTVRLCELGGLAGQPTLVETLRDLYGHASEVRIREGAREALRALGLPDQEIDRRAPIQRILLLEPNGFFRKRMTTVLSGSGRELLAVASREDAAAHLASSPVDLLITESQDEAGELGPWVEQGWSQRRYRYVLMSTSRHDLGSLTGKPWVIGRLYKPYPLGELLKALEA